MNYSILRFTAFVMLLLATSLPAQSQESLYYLPMERSLNNDYHAQSREYIDLVKEANHHLEKRRFYLNKSKKEKSEHIKRFWLSMAVNEQLQRIDALRIAQEVHYRQSQYMAKQFAEMQRSFSSGKLRSELRGLEAMFATLAETLSSEEEASQESSTAATLASVRERLDLLKSAYTKISPSMQERMTEEEHHRITKHLDKQYAQLKTLHAKLTRGEMI